MKKITIHKLLPFLLAFVTIVLFFTLFATSVLVGEKNHISETKENTTSILDSYRSNVIAALEYEYNFPKTICEVIYARDSLVRVVGYDLSFLDSYVQQYLTISGVEYIAVTNSETVTSVYSSNSSYTGGQTLESLDYAYQLCKKNSESIKEGPVDDIISGKKIFLIIEPILRSGEFVGSISVAVSLETLYESFYFNSLDEAGYDYEFWRIHPLDGRIDVLITTNPDANYREAQEISFSFPTRFTLSVIPKGGWSIGYDKAFKYIISTIASLTAGLVTFFLVLYLKYKNIHDKYEWQDQATGLYNRDGFLKTLDSTLKNITKDVSVIYCVIDNISSILLEADEEEEKNYYKHVNLVLAEFIQSPHISGRISGNTFAIAINELLTERELDNICRGLSIELFKKIVVKGESVFPILEFGYTVNKEAITSSSSLLKQSIDDFSNKKYSQSPLTDLKQRCDLLAKGHEKVERKDYPDIKLNDLSKSLFNFYRKTERTLYLDKLSNCGTKHALMRDIKRFITISAKTSFSFFCVTAENIARNLTPSNIFYREEIKPISVEDENTTMELGKVMSTFFGNNAYRVNGCIFLGLKTNLTKEEREELESKLNQTLHLSSFSEATEYRVIVYSPKSINLKKMDYILY